MTTSRFATVSTIVNEAMAELGLSSNTSTDVFASTDAMWIQARTLLNACGQELAGMLDWQSLIKDGSFTAAAAVAPATYGTQAPPADLDRVLPGTTFNTTDDEPLLDATPQICAQAIVSGSGTSPSLVRYEADAIRLYPDASGDSITYKYVSRYWLAATATPTVLSKDAATVNTDVVFFTPVIIKRLLKLRIAQAKKFDFASELAEAYVKFAAGKG